MILNLVILPTIELTDSTVTVDNGTSNGSITIEINNMSGQYDYSWSNGGNTSAIEGLAQGEYCCTVTNEGGCEGMFCFTVGLETSINSLPEDDVVIYPNPLKEGRNLEIISKGNINRLKTSIYNTMGQMVYTIEGERTIDYNFKKGLYIAVVTFDKGKFIKKIVVE